MTIKEQLQEWLFEVEYQITHAMQVKDLTEWGRGSVFELNVTRRKLAEILASSNKEHQQ